MLGAYYRLVAVNEQGASVTVTAKIKRRKFGTDGSLTLEAAPVTLLNAVSIPLSSTTSSTGVDNGTDKYLFAEIEFTVVATSTGLVSLYLSRSVDGGTTYPDAGKGQLIGAINFTASGTQRRVFNLE